MKLYTILLVCLVTTLSSMAATAGSRTGSWDMTVQLLGNFHDTSRGDNGSKLTIDPTVGLGFGAAFNFSEHLQLGGELSFISPDYTATLNADSGGVQAIDAEMEVINGHIYGTWNFMEGPLTPYVRAGLGWTYVDSNIVSSDIPIGVCWWDPWWGYICSDFYDTYDDTRFSYGGGVGVRYEISREYFVQGGVDHYELSGGGLGASPEFDLWRIEFGWRFPTW